MVGTRARRRDDLQLLVARPDPLAVGQLADEIGQVTLGAGPREDRQLESERERFGAGRVVGIGVGQGNCDDAAAGCGCGLQDRVGRGVRRVARVDEDQLAIADEVRVDGLPGHGTRRTDDHAHQPRALPDDARRGCGARADPGPDVLEARGVLELLERRRRREPHRDVARGHGIERGPGGQPAVADDLVGPEDRLHARWQLGREEPRVEAAGHDRRRRPVGDRHEQVRPEPQLEGVGDRDKRCLAVQQRPPGPGDRRRVRSATVAPFREQDARFLEQLPERRDGEPRLACRDVTGQAGVRVGLVDPAAREDEHVAGERHCRGALGQEDLRTAVTGPEEDDGRGGDGSGGEGGAHARSATSAR